LTTVRTAPSFQRRLSSSRGGVEAGGIPGGSGDDLLPDALADVGVLVLVHLLAVVHLHAPGADGGRPAQERDLLPLVVGVEGEPRLALARLGEAAAALVEGEVVPDVAAIDDDLEVHVFAVVLGELRHADGDEQLGEAAGLEI
jgi:hypothetical protein